MSEKIVLIEPDGAMRREFIDTLTGSKYDVCAQGGDNDEALALYQKHHPTAIVLPLVSPKMGGVDALRSIRREDPEAKVIVTYDLESDHLVMQARSNGAAGDIKKPFHAHRALNKLVFALAGTQTPPHKGPVFDLGHRLVVNYKKKGGFFARRRIGYIQRMGVEDWDLRCAEKEVLHARFRLEVALAKDAEPFLLNGVVVQVAEIVPRQSFELVVTLYDVSEDARNKMEQYIVSSVAMKK